jgi:gas vesicle protein
MSKEFAEYREYNDLDRLFAYGMDVPACKKLLAQIKDLTESNQDWAIVNKDLFDTLNATDLKPCLQSIVNDYEKHHNAKLKKMARANEVEEQVRAQEIPPLPPHMFGDQLEAKAGEILQRAIDKTGVIAHEFYNRNFRKMQRHASTQSETVSDIFAEIMRKFKESEEENRKLKFQNDGFVKELSNVTERMNEK